MKVLMMILMIGLMGCKSTPMKAPTFTTNGSHPVGGALFVKKGFDYNGNRLCFYRLELKEIKIPSAVLDRWGAGRCPLLVNLI